MIRINDIKFISGNVIGFLMASYSSFGRITQYLTKLNIVFLQILKH